MLNDMGSAYTCLLGLSKMTVKTSRVFFPHHDEEKSSCHTNTHTHTHTHTHIYIYIYLHKHLVFEVQPSSLLTSVLWIFICGALKIPVVFISNWIWWDSPPTLFSRQINRNRFGAFASVRQPMIRSVRACIGSPLRTFWAFVVNCNLINRT